jgi:hypothetical protein
MFASLIKVVGFVLVRAKEKYVHVHVSIPECRTEL